MTTTPDDKTTAEDERDAKAGHGADRPPTPDEEREAEQNAPVDPAAAAAYKEAIERGAAVRGEGQIDPERRDDTPSRAEPSGAVMPAIEGPLDVVDVSADGDELVLVLRGELDPHTAPILDDQIDHRLTDATRTLVLDVEGLRFIDSAGLRVLIGAHREMTNRGGRLVLRSPNNTTRRLLDITGLTERITVE